MCANRTCSAPTRSRYCSRACQLAALRNPDHRRRITVAVDLDTFRALEQQADEYGLTVPELARELLDEEAAL